MMETKKAVIAREKKQMVQWLSEECEKQIAEILSHMQ